MKGRGEAAAIAEQLVAPVAVSGQAPPADIDQATAQQALAGTENLQLTVKATKRLAIEQVTGPLW
jgi:hypothetical protein